MEKSKSLSQKSALERQRWRARKVVISIMIFVKLLIICGLIRFRASSSTLVFWLLLLDIVVNTASLSEQFHATLWRLRIILNILSLIAAAVAINSVWKEMAPADGHEWYGFTVIWKKVVKFHYIC